METTEGIGPVCYAESSNPNIGWYVFDAEGVIVDGLTREQAIVLCRWINRRRRETA